MKKKNSTSQLSNNLQKVIGKKVLKVYAGENTGSIINLEIGNELIKVNKSGFDILCIF